MLNKYKIPRVRNLLFDVVVSFLQGKHYFFTEYFQGKFALDFGCGGGEFLTREKFNRYGIDINKEALSEAKRRKLKVVCGSVSNVPFRSGIFEAINCDNLIEHLNPKEAYEMLREAARLLRLNGKLIIYTPYPNFAFWNTFSHVRPYPPMSIYKLLTNSVDKESFPTVKKLKPIAIYYEGYYFKTRLLFFLSTAIARILPIARKSYVLILIKSKGVSRKQYEEK